MPSVSFVRSWGRRTWQRKSASPPQKNVENHASYLDLWIKAMKADSKVIFQICSAASKGADLVLSFSRQPQPEEELAVA